MSSTGEDGGSSEVMNSTNNSETTTTVLSRATRTTTSTTTTSEVLQATAQQPHAAERVSRAESGTTETNIRNSLYFTLTDRSNATL